MRPGLGANQTMDLIPNVMSLLGTADSGMGRCVTPVRLNPYPGFLPITVLMDNVEAPAYM